MADKPIKRVHFTCKTKMCDGKPQQYCQCDGCFNVTSVSVLKFPRTMYYDGKKLTTKYTERWYCRECVKKLQDAIVKDRLEHLFETDMEEGNDNG